MTETLELTDPDAVPERGGDAGACVEQGASAACGAAGIAGEVVIADNGSTDGSQAIAAAHGRARRAGRRDAGYGSALLRRHRRGARPLRHHGRRRRQLRLLRPRRRSSTQLRGGRRSGDGQPLPRAASSPAPCRRCTAISATRCSPPSAAVLPQPDRRLPLRAARLQPRRSICGLRPAHDGHGVRQRDGGQGDARTACGSPRCRPRCRPTAAAGRRTCAAGATAGGTCASCCCTARAGCSSSPGWLMFVIGA